MIKYRYNEIVFIEITTIFKNDTTKLNIHASTRF